MKNICPDFKGIQTVYDRDKSFYTIDNPLPNEKRDFLFEFSVEGEAVKEFKVVFKKACDGNTSNIKVIHLQDADDPEAILVKQLALNHQLEKDPNVIARGSSQFKTNQALDIGKNQLLLQGMHSSIRVGTDKEGSPMSMVATDMAASIFERGGKMPHVISWILGSKKFNKISGKQEPTPINNFQMSREKKTLLLLELKGLTVSFQGHFTRKLKIDDITEDGVSDIEIDIQGKKMGVMQYFERKRDPPVKLALPRYPCFIVKRQDGSLSYIPVEICTLLPNQHHDKKLSMAIQSVVTKKTVTGPLLRFQAISQARQEANKIPNEVLSMTVSDEPIKTMGRVLQPPTVQFGKTTEQVSLGGRNPGDHGFKRDFNIPARLDNWAVFELRYKAAEGVHTRIVKFIEELKLIGPSTGMVVDKPRNIATRTIPEEKPYQQLLPFLTKCHSNLSANNKNGILVLVLPYRNSHLYNDIKNIGNQLGLLTQCISLENLTKRDKQGEFVNLKTMVENILKKMNAKLGGVNVSVAKTSLGSFPRYTMVVGMDVYHPGEGDPQRGKCASIVGVLASYNPGMTKYFSATMSQPQAQDTFTRKEEVEKGLDRVMINFFERFAAKNKKYPENIIFIRDGVSDGQLEQVLKIEATQVFTAMAKLRFEAKLQLVSVQKRHPIRLFRVVNGQVTNPLPGTVVDKDIVHPVLNEFYINSHHPLQGTGKPAQYKLLLNDCDMDSDRIQEILYYLCYGYQRCTKPISVPAAVRYADQVAERAAGILESTVRNGLMKERSIDEVIRIHENFQEWLVFQ